MGNYNTLYTVTKHNRKALNKRLLWSGGVIPGGLMEGAGISGTSDIMQNNIDSAANNIQELDIKGLDIGKDGASSLLSKGSNIAGAASGIIGAASDIAGAFKETSSINQEAINAAQEEIDANKNAKASASSFDSLSSQWSQWRPQDNVDWKDLMGQSKGEAAGSIIGAIGSGASAGAALGPIGAVGGALIGGLVSGFGRRRAKKKAKKQAAELNQKIKEANAQRVNTFNQNVENLMDEQASNYALNYAAYGGPINMRYSGVMSPFGNQFKDGGKIHIKPENRGKFTALKKRTGKSATWFKEHGTPAQKKMAIFALNARKWKHNDGGFIDNAYGGVFSNGITKINEGGTHEQNPYEGIQLGIDSQGIPNLVEEGEIIWNDYVFSNRLKVPDLIKKEHRFIGSTFADVAKNIQKESEERPNDPISKNGLETNLSILRSAQEIMRNKKYTKSNKFAAGGDTDGYNFEYTPNADYYKEGLLPEVTVVAPKSPRSNPSIGYTSMNVNGNISPLSIDTYEPTAFSGFYLDSDNNGIEISGSPYDISGAPDDIMISSYSPTAIESTATGNTEREKKSSKNKSKSKSKKALDLNASALRYAPVIGSALQVIQGNPVEYDNSDIIGRAANNLGYVRSNSIGQKLAYKPLDRNFYINYLNANNAANRRAITTMSGGNKATALAGLIANNYNSNRELGNLMRQAEEYNAAQREKVAGFNRQTDMFNAEQALKADLANQEQDRARLKAKITEAQMREEIKRNTEAARSANLTNLFDNLGNIGLEDYTRNMINSNQALYYGVTGSGNSYYKNKKKRGGAIWHI